MWIVKNILRGRLTFKGLGISIPPRGEFDLDVIGRGKAETSNQIQVAFEEGYLQNMRKDASEEPLHLSKQPSRDGLQEKLSEFKSSLISEIRSLFPDNTFDPAQDVFSQLDKLRDSIAGGVEDVEGLLDKLKVRLQNEKERLTMDSNLSDAEIKARLAFLSEKELELDKNFDTLGKKSATKKQKTDLLNRVDMLSQIDLISPDE